MHVHIYIYIYIYIHIFVIEVCGVTEVRGVPETSFKLTSTQVYKQISPIVRKSMTHLFIYRLRNYGDFISSSKLK